MKKYYVIFTVLFMILQSCSSELNEVSNAVNGHQTSITAQIDNSMTRMSFTDQEANEIMKVQWGASESFSLFNSTSAQVPTEFTKTGTDVGTSASFTGNVLLTESQQIYAVYPKRTETGNIDPGNVPFDFSSQDGLLSTIQSKAPMFSNAAYAASGTNLTFLNAACILKLQLTFPSAVSVNSLKLSSSSLHNQGKLDITKSAATWSLSNTGDITASFSPALTTATDNTITAWLLVFPESFGGVTITCNDGTNDYTATINSTTSLTAGKLYKVIKTMTKSGTTNVITYSDDNIPGVAPTVGDGTQYNPYQLSTAANIQWLKTEARGGSYKPDCQNNTYGKYYKLMCDVNVTSTSWAAIGGDNSSYKAFQGTFDGDNHTISGALNVPSGHTAYYGIFGLLNGGCVKNLINNATVNGSGCQSVGGIVGGVVPSYSTYIVPAIINCQNSGSISGTDNVGGILGYVKGNKVGNNDLPTITSDFILVENCKNTGNVNSSSKYAGGIVGYLTTEQFNTASTGTMMVKSCENKGNVSVATSYSGGLFGLVSATYPIKISNCTEGALVSVTASGTSAVDNKGTSSAFAGKLWGGVWTPANFTDDNNVVK